LNLGYILRPETGIQQIFSAYRSTVRKSGKGLEDASISLQDCIYLAEIGGSVLIFSVVEICATGIITKLFVFPARETPAAFIAGFVHKFFHKSFNSLLVQQT